MKKTCASHGLIRKHGEAKSRARLLWAFDPDYLSNSWHKIILSGVVFALSFFFLVHVAEIYANRVLLSQFAGDIYRQLLQIDFQVKHGLRNVESSNSTYCSDADMTVMRQQLNVYHFLDDLGRVVDGRIVCTLKRGLLQSPIVLIGAAAQSSTGILHWNNQDRLFVPNTEPPTMTYGNAVAFVSSAYLSSLGAYKSIPIGSGGYVYLKNNDYIFRIFGKLELEHIRDMQDYEVSFWDWIPLPGSMVRTRFCSEDSDICLMMVVSGAGILNRSIAYIILMALSCLALGIFIAFAVVALRGGPNAFVRKLRGAIKSGTIYPEYQPKIDLSSGRIVGVEALARWEDRTLGKIEPDFFIHVAEQSGLIAAFIESFVKQVFVDLREVLETNKDFTVSINISPDDIVGRGFLFFMNREIASYRFRRQQVVIEITERTTSNSEAMIRAVKRIKENGYRISLDDFGTGFSNLSWLTAFEPDEIKIDKMFTQSIDTDTVNSITLGGMFSMIDHLDVEVVFEGIESEKQLSYIRSRVPKASGQGWLFLKSVPANELMEYLQPPAQLFCCAES